jgi:hypothetical protein
MKPDVRESRAHAQARMLLFQPTAQAQLQASTRQLRSRVRHPTGPGGGQGIT